KASIIERHGVGYLAVSPLGSTPDGTRVYSAGGWGNGTVQTSIELATFSNGILSTWQTLTPLPVPLHDPQLAVINGYLYVFGGEGVPGDTTPSRDVRRAPIQSNGTIGAWSLVGQLKDPRPHSGLLQYGGMIHVTAGGVNNYMTNSVESITEGQLGN